MAPFGFVEKIEKNVYNLIPYASLELVDTRLIKILKMVAMKTWVQGHPSLKINNKK